MVGIVVGGLLAMLLLLGGCGGGDDSSSSAPPLSKSEFVKQADAICQKAHKKITTGYKQNEGEAGGGKEYLEEAIKAVVLPALQEEADSIDELGPPKGEEAKVESLVQELESKVETGESEPFHVLGPSSWEPVQQVAVELGLTVCASPT